MTSGEQAKTPLQAPILLTNVKPVGFGKGASEASTDILIGGDGKIAAVGSALQVPADAQRIDAKGAFMSPGWALVDAGSAGEANFHGFREYIIEPSRERIKAFLNLGSIGLVACNRVPELRDIKDIDLDRILECYAENSEHIVGLKVRASHVITGSWGVTPVKLGKKIAKILKVPMMVHVGEPPALYDEVLEILGPGDVVL
ncbi:MAG: amidohydrolase/deacetylase family metallohydrolase, partial [Rhizobium pusense]|nr:amidohydrolase/deacetylase family metallohydrolase [Agrobacterium pusense]